MSLKHTNLRMATATHTETVKDRRPSDPPGRDVDSDNKDASSEAALPAELISAGSQQLHRRLGGKEIQLFAVGGAIGTCTCPAAHIRWLTSNPAKLSSSKWVRRYRKVARQGFSWDLLYTEALSLQSTSVSVGAVLIRFPSETCTKQSQRRWSPTFRSRRHLCGLLGSGLMMP